MFVDCHSHLNDPAFDGKVPAVLERSRVADVGKIVVSAYDYPSLARTAALASAFPEVILPTYGIHPWFVEGFHDYEDLWSFLQRKECIAVGEIGLDFSPEFVHRDLQVESFTRQVDWAKDHRLPVIIHCRKAYDELYRILLPYEGRIGGLIHSFSGGENWLSRFVDLGFYVSFSGSVTRPNARKYHRVARIAPLDCILLETDCPSIATESTVASEVEPRHVIEIAAKIAEIRNMQVGDMERHTTENALTLFKVPQEDK
ncbi:MAG: TatD family hydrolase [Smithellaceae bacterium]|nr:TatD family hydrolase [Smithellaceae bacterium]